MGAVMARGQVAAARGAALERVRARRCDGYRTVTEAERRQAWLRGEDLREHDWHAPAVRPAQTLGEWIDDRVLEWGQMPHGEGPLLVTVLEAARDSAAAACGALAAARGLEPAQQWAAFRNIEAWRADGDAARLGADRLAAALLAGWRRLRLAEEDPAAAPEPARRRRPWEAGTAAAS